MATGWLLLLLLMMVSPPPPAYETPSERIQVTRGKEYVFVYASTGKSFGLKMGVIPGEKAAYYWVNPRNGEQSNRNIISNSGVQTFTPPSKGYGLDWVMVLETN